MKTHLTMQELEDLGFEMQRSYTHDEWTTQVRKKGCITIETTYVLSGAFVSQEVKIETDFLKLSEVEFMRMYHILKNKK